MQIWAESGKSALPICNYSQILYQFLTFTQNLKRSHFFTRPPPAAGRASDILPFRCSAILAERFYRMETKFPIR